MILKGVSGNGGVGTVNSGTVNNRTVRQGTREFDEYVPAQSVDIHANLL